MVTLALLNVIVLGGIIFESLSQEYDLLKMTGFELCVTQMTAIMVMMGNKRTVGVEMLVWGGGEAESLDLLCCPLSEVCIQ